MSGYQLTEADRNRLGLCLHEASHAVAGVLAGATIERAALTDDGTDGECTFTADSFAHDSRRYHRALVAAAGPVASAVFTHGDGPSPRQLDAALGDGDREELRLATFHSERNHQEMLAAAVPVVRRCWPSITALAVQIWAGNDVTHDDVLAALGITDGGGPRSPQLSLIASGAVTPRPLKVKAKAGS